MPPGPLPAGSCAASAAAPSNSTTDPTAAALAAFMSQPPLFFEALAHHQRIDNEPHTDRDQPAQRPPQPHAERTVHEPDAPHAEGELSRLTKRAAPAPRACPPSRSA